MPVAILGAVLAGVVGAGSAILAAGGIAAATFLGGALTGWAAIGAAFAVGFVGSLLVSGATALLGNQSSAREVPFSAEASARTQMVRSPIASRKMVVGETVASGALVFAASYGLANGQTPTAGTLNRDDLALVIVVAAHEIAQIGAVWLNDTSWTANRFAGLVNVIPHTGAAGQVADPTLLAANVGWTADHRGDGLSYLVVTLHWDPDAFPTGIPNVKCSIRGALPYDPRTATSGWTDNAALVARHYLQETDLGLASPAGEIADSTFIAAANTSDEIVDLPASGDYIRNVNNLTDTPPGTKLYVQGDPDCGWATGDRVQVSSVGGAVPSGLTAGTDYYLIRTRDTQTNATWPNGISFATTLANARAFSAIALADFGSGIVQVTRTGQPRYTCNGIIDCAKAPGQILDQIMSASAGIVVWQQGQHRHYVGATKTAVFTLDESDLRGPLQILPRQAKRDLCNAVRGTFIDPANAWQPSDFAAQENATYVAEDGGDEIWRDIELPYTTDALRAQRLAHIVLEAMRQGMSVKWPSKARALKVAVGDAVSVSLTVGGASIWSSKVFEVQGWALAEDGGIDLVLREYADEIFAWDPDADPVTTDPSPNTSLPNPWAVADVGIAGFSEELVATRSGAGVASRLTVSWSPAVDAFVARYDLQYRASGATDWTPLPPTAETAIAIDDIAAGAYEFRLRAVNTIGVQGDWSAIAAREVVGLTAPPADVTGFTLTPLSGMGVLRWDRAADLDVLNGGSFRIRHSVATSGATWPNSTDLFPSGVAGAATEATVPLLSGTYLIKAIDSVGNESVTAATIVTTRPDVVARNVVLTITESPAFSGTKTNVAAPSGELQLDAVTPIDSWGAVDSILSWDFEGGVQTSGTYLFGYGTADLGKVYVSRVSAAMAVVVFSALDYVDSRSGDIDDWPDFDGLPAGAVATATIECRITSDDPAGSPTWSGWLPFLAAEFTARAYQFRARLESNDASVNIKVTSLAVTIDMPDRTDEGSVLTSAGADTAVVFPDGAFWATPVLGYTIQSAATGDYVDFSGVTTTGFNVSVRNAAGSRIAKTVNWIAKGYGQGT